MIAYPRSESQNATLSIRVVGVGNAGVHLADRIAMSGLRGVEVIAMNCDAQSLAASVAPRKASLGTRATRGLGAGGDPEVGHEAGQESIEEIRFALEGASVVIIVAGLGGGTGSGVTPLVAEIAREAGAFVFCLATLPFSFEGRRRATQATEAEAATATHAHVMIRFENDRMAELASPRSGISETFAASDTILSACVVSFLEMLVGHGPLPVSLGSLTSALAGGPSSAIFGRGSSSGDNRAHEALEAAMKSPLLDRGHLLDDAHAVIAHISGPPSLSFSETAAIMREVSKHVSENARLFLGVSALPDADAPLSVTLLGTCATSIPQPRPHREASRPQAPIPKAPPPTPPPPTEEDSMALRPPGRLFADDEPAEPIVPTAKPAPKPAAATKKAAAEKPQARPKAKQETLQFESVTRGRFEKSEPTIVEGEDLDVPTFLRLRK